MQEWVYKTHLGSIFTLLKDFNQDFNSLDANASAIVSESSYLAIRMYAHMHTQTSLLNGLY